MMQKNNLKEINLFIDNFDKGHQKAIFLDILNNTLLKYKILWKERDIENNILFDLEHIESKRISSYILKFKNVDCNNLLKNFLKKYLQKNYDEIIDNFYKNGFLGYRSIFEIIVLLLINLKETNIINENLFHEFLNNLLFIFSLKIDISGTKEIIKFLFKNKKENKKAILIALIKNLRIIL
ncbi:hypothetical protein MM26B8_01800 [Mycoplasmopsis meleagridis]|uniref:Uncharacterized protein n=1 Tax=Mycoplasmopsis meleagridis ATCC 25294 TaxID=1264554 RepID=A0A0F5H298_9BACT|nr:hypothetical protein [Mycoplasmopsis meleagridis]KKB26962.1 hypothetical protein MMELEA_04160 [Mycoplasmopsis meleagridis ATCC 25294]OAD18551.1 hypothetical protein MM26B8_01800 [Mycoplasmopsis meleagridis]